VDETTPVQPASESAEILVRAEGLVLGAASGGVPGARGPASIGETAARQGADHVLAI